MILEAVAFDLLLPLLAAGIVAAAASRAGKAGRALGGVIGLIVAFVVGNHFREAAEYRIETDWSLASEVFHAFAGRPDGSAHPPARNWLPWAALFAASAGLLVRVGKVPPVMRHLLRALVAVSVARLLVDPRARLESAWLWPAFAAVVLAEWEVLDTFGEEGVWPPAALGLAFLGAGAVLLHAHTARLTDLATFVAGGFLGVALAVRWAGADVRATAPIVAVFLPGLMLDGYRSTYSEVPAASFVLAALAPLALVLVLLAPERYRRRRALAGLGLLLAATGAAVFLASRAEPLPFE